MCVCVCVCVGGGGRGVTLFTERLLYKNSNKRKRSGVDGVRGQEVVLVISYK